MSKPYRITIQERLVELRHVEVVKKGKYELVPYDDKFKEDRDDDNEFGCLNYNDEKAEEIGLASLSDDGYVCLDLRKLNKFLQSKEMQKALNDDTFECIQLHASSDYQCFVGALRKETDAEFNKRIAGNKAKLEKEKAKKAIDKEKKKKDRILKLKKELSKLSA